MVPTNHRHPAVSETKLIGDRIEKNWLLESRESSQIQSITTSSMKFAQRATMLAAIQPQAGCLIIPTIINIHPCALVFNLAQWPIGERFSDSRCPVKKLHLYIKRSDLPLENLRARSCIIFFLSCSFPFFHQLFFRSLFF